MARFTVTDAQRERRSPAARAGGHEAVLNLLRAPEGAPIHPVGERTEVRCTACDIAFGTVLSARVVESVRRCPTCGQRALVVVSPEHDQAAYCRRLRRDAMAAATRAIELRAQAEMLLARAPGRE